MRFAFPMLLPLAACVATPPPPNGTAPPAQEAIRYETSACFGACPVYAVTVRPDGTGTFEGQRFTVATGAQTIVFDPADYRRFAAALAPYRPATGGARYAPGEPNCGNAPTDMPSVTVTWQRPSGAAAQTLFFYHGCRPEAAPGMAEALRRAPDLLPPLKALIGPPQVGR